MIDRTGIMILSLIIIIAATPFVALGHLLNKSPVEIFIQAFSEHPRPARLTIEEVQMVCYKPDEVNNK